MWTVWSPSVPETSVARLGLILCKTQRNNITYDFYGG